MININGGMWGHEAVSGIEAVAHKLCAGLSLKPVTVYWTTTVRTAAISSTGSLYLSPILPDQRVSRAMFLRYVGYVVHELLHRAYTNFHVNGTGQYVQTLHNAVEDAWIERKAIKANLLGNIDNLLGALIEGMVQEALLSVTDWSDPAQYPFALAVYCRPHALTKVPLAQGLDVIFAEANRRVDTCTSSADTLAVAEWVFKQLNLTQDGKSKDQGKDQGKQGKQSKDQGNGEGKQGSGEGEGKGEGKGEGEGKQGKDAPVGPRKAPANGRHSDAQRVEPQSPQVDGPPAHGGSYSNRSDEVRPLRVPLVSGDSLPQVNSAKMRREIKTLLENSGTEQHDHNRRAGSVNVGALHRVAYDDRLFKRRTEIEGVDSAVFILLDNSGSMSTEIKTAASVAAALYSASMAAQAATKLAIFNSIRRESEWNVPVAQMNRILASVSTSGSTEDYQSLRWASNDLLTRSEQRKVLIVITDGNGDWANCKQWVQSLERTGMIVIGVGIGVPISRIYKHSVLVQNTQAMAGLTFGAVIKALK